MSTDFSHTTQLYMTPTSSLPGDQNSFQHWGIKKQIIETSRNRPSFKERDIFWCSIGKNIGDEEHGKGDDFFRPILIVRKFNKHIFLGIPLSTKLKPNNPYYIKISFQGKEISGLTSQIRVLDSKRLYKQMGTLDSHNFDNIVTCLYRQLFQNFTPFISEGGVATNVDL